MMTPKVGGPSAKVGADEKWQAFSRRHCHHHQTNPRHNHHHSQLHNSTSQQSANNNNNSFSSNNHLVLLTTKDCKTLPPQLSLWWYKSSLASENVRSRSEKMPTVRSKMGRGSSNSCRKSPRFHLHLWSLVLFFSLTLTTLLTSTSAGTSSSSSSSSFPSFSPSSSASILPSYSSSSSFSSPLSHSFSSSPSSPSSFASSSPSLYSKLFFSSPSHSLQSTGSEAKPADDLASIRKLLLPRPPPPMMMAMLGSPARQQQTEQLWSSKQKRSAGELPPAALAATTSDQQHWNIPRQILNARLQLAKMVEGAAAAAEQQHHQLAANEQPNLVVQQYGGKTGGRKDWRSLINLITAANSKPPKSVASAADDEENENENDMSIVAVVDNNDDDNDRDRRRRREQSNGRAAQMLSSLDEAADKWTASGGDDGETGSNSNSSSSNTTKENLMIMEALMQQQQQQQQQAEKVKGRLSPLLSPSPSASSWSRPEPGPLSLRSPLSKRRLVINSSNGARLYVDPRRGVDWPSDEEAIERGLRLPDSHPRRPPQGGKFGSGNGSGNGNKQRTQNHSGYYYRQPGKSWANRESLASSSSSTTTTTTSTTTTTTTTTTPSPPIFSSKSFRGGGGVGNRFNKTSSAIALGQSGNFVGNFVGNHRRPTSDRYYDVDQHRAQFGHRYYGGQSQVKTTSAPQQQLFRPAPASSVLGNSWFRGGGNSGGNFNSRSSNSILHNNNHNSRDSSKNNNNNSNNSPNYLAHLYRTNRTAWEAEYRKYQQFAAEAKQRGHVYGKVSRVNREAAGGSSSASASTGDSDRLYDVPQVDCPSTENGVDRFACPTADAYGRFLCIDDQHICNGYTDCPRGEDEDTMSCMFYKSTKAHLDVLADYLLQWARGRHF